MREFILLYEKLRNQPDPLIQCEFVKDYLNKQSIQNQEWAIYLLRGGPTNRLFSTAELIEIAQGQISFSLAIYERCLDFTADAIEAISLMLPLSTNTSNTTLAKWMDQIMPLDKKNKIENNDFVLSAWKKLNAAERYLFNRLISNSWRSPISQMTLIRSLSQFFKISIQQQAYNLFHTPLKSKSTIDSLSRADTKNESMFPVDFVRPTLIPTIDPLEEPSNYWCACEWNGVRVQWVLASQESTLWTARNELITDKLPELNIVEPHIPRDTIIDGIVLAIDAQSILPKSVVRKRLTRKRITPKIVSQTPLVFCAIDLIKIKNKHLMDTPFKKRQKLLEGLIKTIPQNQSIQTSDELKITNWSELSEKWDTIKSINSTAIIIKEKNSLYNQNANWFKYKAARYQAKGILLYAKRGEGAQSNQYIEYTLGARAGGKLIPVAKVKPRLHDDDNLKIKQFIKDNLIERFGPVYSVKAELIFQFEFEAVHESKRRKCGFLLKNPIFISWIKEETLDQVTPIDFYTDLL